MEDASVKYKKLGFNYIDRIYKFYGFRLNEKLRLFNRPLITLGLIFMSLVFCDGMAKTHTKLKYRGRLTTEHLCYIIAGVSIQFSLAFHYVSLFARFKSIRIHIERIVNVIQSCIAEENSIATKIRARCRLMSIVMVISLAVFAIVKISILSYNIKDSIDRVKKDQIDAAKSYIFLTCLTIIFSWWMVFVVGCCIFCSLLIVFLCYYLIYFIDLYMPISKFEDLKIQQIKHQNVCMIIRSMDRLFSNYMMTTLVFELLTIVVYTRGFYETTGGAALNIALNSIQTLMFTVKNIACSSLNDKVMSALIIPANDNYGKCSAEHINYIMYMKQLMNDKPEITYGGFFTISKTFIFTVFGTAISYAMILRGL